MSRRFSSKWILSLAVLLATVAQAVEVGQRPSTRLAALALPTGPGADWQQWDSFLTNVVKKLSESFQPALRDQLAEVFLDSRYRLTDTLRSGISDPVPQLFTESWNRLSPLLKQAVANVPQQTAAQYTSFIGAMDAATSLAGLGRPWVWCVSHRMRLAALLVCSGPAAQIRSLIPTMWTRCYAP